MDELASKQVLLDFELVALLALVLGVAIFGVVRTLGKREAGGVDVSAHGAFGRFDGLDLLLVFLPALFFLYNPLYAVHAAKTQTAGTSATAQAQMGGLVLYACLFIIIGVFTFGINAWVRNRNVVALFGLKRLRWPVVLILAIAGGGVSWLVCGLGIGSIAKGFIDRLFTDLSVQDNVELLSKTTSFPVTIMMLLLACVIAPLVEELLFRGYFYGALKQATNGVFSAAIIGALFAAAHGNFPAFIPLWAFSILLTLAYEWTRCLWVPIGMHAVFNTISAVLILNTTSAG